MILAVDVGNTNIVIGGFSLDGELKFQLRIGTDPKKTTDEYAVLLSSVIAMHNAKPPFKGVILSSVVPAVSSALMGALEDLSSSGVLVVGPGVKTGFEIRLDDPSELGADLAASTAGAIKKYTPPMLVVDLGTATKFTAISEKGAFLGGSILPGVKISADALFSSAALLSSVSLKDKVNLIGKNTADCIRSGILLGSASMIDGMIKRYKEELGENLTVIASGGLASMVIPYCREDIILDEKLVLDGLFAIYIKNKK
jgi:type III pantothenate kinase